MEAGDYSVTVPSDVTEVNVVTRSETRLVLEWTKVNNSNNYTYMLRNSNGAETSITGSDAGTTVKHKVSSLSAGTNYSFTLFTVFEGVTSTGLTFSAVTVPSDVTKVNVVIRSETQLELEWTKVSNNNNYIYMLRNSNGAEASITVLHEGTTVKHTISSLSAGTKYSFTLFTVFEGVRSTGYNFSEFTIPPDVTQVNVVTRSETQLKLEWTKVNNDNNYIYMLRNSNRADASITGSDAGTTVKHKVSSLSAGTNYSFTLFTVFEGVRSTGYNFSEVTLPPDVTKVNVTRSETQLELEWNKVNNNNNCNYMLRNSNGAETNITGSDAETTVKHKVSSLSAGTNYSFTLFTVFEGVSSTGLTFSAVTVPSDVTEVNVVTRSETRLVLEWTKVNNSNNYIYMLRKSNGAEASITGSDARTTVKHKVSSLSAGTKYSFTLFTVFEGVRSTGYNFSEVTLPPDVIEVNVVTRSETRLVLEWTKVNNNNNYIYMLRKSNGAEASITGSDAGTTVKHKVSSLSAGTNYSFTLFTVFEGVRSTGYNFSEVTLPPDVTQVNVVNRSETQLELEWNKVNNNNNCNYMLRNSNGAETNITGSDAGTTVKHTVSSLSAGTNYSFTLFTVFEGVSSTGLTFSAVTVPPDVIEVNVVTRSETQLELEWTKVNNNNNYIYMLRNSNGAEASITGLHEGTTVKHTISSLSAGTKYSFTLFTVFEGVRSTGYNFSEFTIPPDVTQVNVVNRSETQLKLEWTKVNNNNNYNYILRNSNGAEANITGSDARTTVKHKVSSLSAGTNYSFTLFTVFEGVANTGLTFSAVTAPSDVTEVNVVTRCETRLVLEWTKVNNNNNYIYMLRNSSGAEASITGSDAGTTVKHKVSSLSAGTNYSFTLFTVFEGVTSTGFEFSEVTIPPDVTKVNVTRSETQLELEWNKVNNDNNYNYMLRNSNGAETNITGSDAGTTVKHTVSSLSAGTNYSFTLFTVFEGVSSTGLTFSAVTVPPDVSQVNVVNRSETQLKQEWNKVNNDNNYNYILRNSNGAETNITGSDAGTTVKHTVSSLSAGTNYSFTLFTVFEGVSSTGLTFSAVTVPSDVTEVNVVTRCETRLVLEWTKVNNNNNYIYMLRNSSGAEASITGSDAGTTVKHKVSSLSAGTNYSFTLFTVFEGVRSTGYNFSEVTLPPDVSQVNVVNRSETQLELEWNKVNNNNNCNYMLRNSNGAETNITGSDAGTTVKHTVSSLSAGTNYSFTLFTVFEGVSSTGLTFSAVTVPSDVTEVNVVTRSETRLVLEWTKVNNNNNYIYMLRNSSGAEASITGSDAGTTVKHKVSSLSAGTNYSFTLFTVFEGVRSTGYNFSEVTQVPVTFKKKLQDLTVQEQDEGRLEVELSKPSNEVKWMKNGVVVQPGGSVDIIVEGARQTLLFKNVTQGDRGHYSCETLDDKTQAKLTVKENDLRVVLLWKGGAGKSSLANRLLGGEAAKIKTGLCVWKQGEHDGKKITVVDTPGWDRVSVDHTSEQIKHEIIRSTTLCLPGPHALLLVLPVSQDGEVPSDKEIQSHCQHIQLLSEKAWRYTMVLFACEGEVEQSVIDQHLKATEKLVEKCEGRYFIIQKDTPVPELLQEIKSLVSDNSGNCLPFQDYYSGRRDQLEELKEKSKNHGDRTKTRRGSSEFIPPTFAFFGGPTLMLITFAFVGCVLGLRKLMRPRELV
ncbi:uncharacterized protein LOC143132618 [Alosa pseudoharengus]|uniref:uncharacterized protein LOC143132618 n=1 Tax=Alosa pseudoharengus TaxID=34774 RepID=UPI003F8B0C18